MLVNKFCDIGWRKVIHIMSIKTHYEYFKMRAVEQNRVTVIHKKNDFVPYPMTLSPNLFSLFWLLFKSPKDGELTDMISFYTLPSSIMHHPVHKQLKAAYAFYNVATSTTWEILMLDALTLARQVLSLKKKSHWGLFPTG